jgi:hypothetical protein
MVILGEGTGDRKNVIFWFVFTSKINWCILTNKDIWTCG